MTSPAFDTIIEASVFSELHGFVLADPATLDAFHRQPTTGLDLLTLYTTSHMGHEVCEAGAVVPVIGLAEAGYFTLILRSAGAPSELSGPPTLVSSGWVLHVTSGRVALCGLGYLQRWNAQHAAVRHAQLPPGWYGVEIALGQSPQPADDFALEFTLTSGPTQPRFTADLSRLFGPIDSD